MTAITKGKVAPVYVFAGPHGTGKTSCARVFAAALVCLNTEPHRRPCGLCRECATITLNWSRDVKEIDVGNCSDLDQLKALLNLSSLFSHQQQGPVLATRQTLVARKLEEEAGERKCDL